MIIRYFGICARLQCIALEIWIPRLDGSQSWSIGQAICGTRWAGYINPCKLDLGHSGVGCVGTYSRSCDHVVSRSHMYRVRHPSTTQSLHCYRRWIRHLHLGNESAIRCTPYCLVLLLLTSASCLVHHITTCDFASNLAS
jgi:hypothetical protein